MDKREKFIIDCVNALQEVTHAHGFGAISQDTLCKIVEFYARHYNSPAIPGKRFRSQPPGDFDMSDNILNLFGRPKAVKQESNGQNNEEMDFSEIIKKNQENTERMEKDRAKANKGITRSHRLNKK
jgi:hypothetical protein